MIPEYVIDSSDSIDKRNRCWLCGTAENITRHHLEMKRNRKNNLGTIPLCLKCHVGVEQQRKGMKNFYRKYYRDKMIEFFDHIKGVLTDKQKKVLMKKVESYFNITVEEEK